MNIMIDTNKFIESIKINKYKNHIDSKKQLKLNYSKAIIKDLNEEIEIVCFKHGSFFQTPSIHLTGKGCPSCKDHTLSEKKDNFDSFLKEAKKKHGEKFTYNNTIFTSSEANLLVSCVEHGDFEVKASTHLKGNGGCSACGYLKLSKTRTRSRSNFIELANKIHNGKYGYDKTDYISTKIKVTITCDIHGDFLQIPDSHLSGTGCPKCSRLISGWTRTDFIERCKKNNNGLGILYFLRCFNDTESFYKIGITSISIIKRFQTSPIPYSYEVLREVQDDPSKVYNLEHQLLRELADRSYTPLISFAGKTECFSNLGDIDQLLL